MTTPLRLHHAGLDRWFIVQDGAVCADLDGDGRISRRDAIPDPALAPVASAARYFAEFFEAVPPGTPSREPGITAGGVLNAREAAVFAGGPPGVEARRPDMLGHLDFFDRRTRDGVIGLGENYQGWRDLGFGPLRSVVQALGSALVFGRLGRALAIDVEEIARRRPRGASGVYGPDGNVDGARLAQFAAMFDGHDHLTHDQLRAGLAARAQLGRVPKRQFESLCALTARMNGGPSITRAQFVGLFDHSLFWTAVSMPRGAGGRRL